MPAGYALLVVLIAQLTALAAVWMANRSRDESLVRARLRLIELAKVIEEAKTKPKAAKKVRKLQREYKSLRSYLMKRSMVESFKYALLFMLVVVVASTIYPVVPSPVNIPLITVVSEEGMALMPSAVLVFLVYLLNTPWIQKAMGVTIRPVARESTATESGSERSQRRSPQLVAHMPQALLNTELLTGSPQRSCGGC